MKILFFYRGAESFGIEQLSAVLKEAGHKTGLIFDPGLDDTFYFKARISKLFNVKRKLLDEAKRFSPDLIAFSSTTNLYPYVKEMAFLLKKELNVPAVIGGIHATVLPDYVLKEDCFDILCVGEGEQAMLELAGRMEEGRDFSDIKNLWIKRKGGIIRNPERPLIQDLDALPSPDKDIFFRKGAFWKSIQVATSRGCPYRCSFCVNSFFSDRYGSSYFRRRGVAKVIAEIKSYKEKYHPEFIDFQDDVFPVSLPWLEEFSDKYKREVGIKFLVNIHPGMVNKRIARLLKEAGCCGVCMGVQSGNERLRKDLLKRGGTNEEVIEAARFLKEADIRLVTEFIFGLPRETEEEAWQSVLLNQAIRPYGSSTFLFYPFPGTELAESCYRQGLIDDKSMMMINEGFGSYHTALFLKGAPRDYFLNLSYFLPLLVKMPWLARNRYFRKFCARKASLLNRIIGICVIPFHNPMLFKEKLLNYMRMFWVYLFH